MRTKYKGALKSNTIIDNSLLSVIYKIVGLGVSLVTMPLLLRLLGADKLGVWEVIASLISWLCYADLGIGGGLRNRLASLFSIGDYDSSSKYIGTAYTMVAGISILVFSTYCIVAHIISIENELRISIQSENINLCLNVAVGLACINFVLSLADNILYAVQKSSFVYLFNLFFQTMFLGLICLYLYMDTSKVLYIAIGDGICLLIKNIVESLWIYKHYRGLFTINLKLEPMCVKAMMSFGIQLFAVQITALVLNSTDNLVISRMVGTTGVTSYFFCYKYFCIIQLLYVAVISPLLSAYTAAAEKKDYVWIENTIKSNMLVYVFFVFITVIAAFVFKPFSLIWLKEDLRYSNVLIISMAVYMIVLMFIHIFTTFLTGIGKIKETTIASVIGAIINIPLSVFFMRFSNINIAGASIGSAISLSITAIVAPMITIKFLKYKRSLEE